MKEKKTFKFTIASGWSSTIEAYGILWAITKLKERGHDVKKIEELEVSYDEWISIDEWITGKN